MSPVGKRISGGGGLSTTKRCRCRSGQTGLGVGRQRTGDKACRVANHAHGNVLIHYGRTFVQIHVLHDYNRRRARSKVWIGRIAAMIQHDGVFLRRHVRDGGFKEDAHSSRGSTDPAAGPTAASAYAREPGRPFCSQPKSSRGVVSDLCGPDRDNLAVEEMDRLGLLPDLRTVAALRRRIATGKASEHGQSEECLSGRHCVNPCEISPKGFVSVLRYPSTIETLNSSHVAGIGP